MGRTENQKLKLLYLKELFERQSDEEHLLSMQDILDALAAQGIRAERKSVYDDILCLQQFGMDIVTVKGRNGGYFLASRTFELPELKLLVDAVQSSKFLSERKSMQLIAKLETLASGYAAGSLRRQVTVAGRVKTMNESIYYNVDRIHDAIAHNSQITFRYFDYDMHRNKVFRREGRRYAVSPYGLIWNSENYSMVAFDHSHQEMRHYRVDKMTEIAVTSLPRQGREQYPDFQLAQYGQKHFGMYSGREVTVTLRGRRDMAGVVWDRFGQEVILVPDGEEHFTVTLPVVMSPQFFGWLFGLDGGLVLTAPRQAVDEYRRKMTEALHMQPEL